MRYGKIRHKICPNVETHNTLYLIFSNMTYILFLAIGLIFILIGLKVKEEVYRLSGAFIGTIILIWGFVLTPVTFQFIVELGIVFSVFSICVRCWECES